MGDLKDIMERTAAERGEELDQVIIRRRRRRHCRDVMPCHVMPCHGGWRAAMVVGALRHAHA